MERAADRRDGDGAEARFRPIIELGTGLVAGAELLGPAEQRGAALAFAFGAPAAEGWWLALELGTGAVVAPAAGRRVAALLRESGLGAERLLLRVTEAELVGAAASGSARSLAALGVRFLVTGFGSGGGSIAALRSAPVAFLELSLAGLDPEDPSDVAAVRSAAALAGSLGIDVIGTDVECDGQLALAGASGIGLVQGYWWGSPGSLAKLVATWGRPPISE